MIRIDSMNLFDSHTNIRLHFGQRVTSVSIYEKNFQSKKKKKTISLEQHLEGMA